jgi:hypothetical protein
VGSDAQLPLPVDPTLAGDAGLTGLAADTGLTGVAADTGLTGLVADTGLTGLAADTGLTGLAADTGLTGLATDTGLAADTGDTALGALSASMGAGGATTGCGGDALPVACGAASDGRAAEACARAIVTGADRRAGLARPPSRISSLGVTEAPSGAASTKPPTVAPASVPNAAATFQLGRWVGFIEVSPCCGAVQPVG